MTQPTGLTAAIKCFVIGPIGDRLAPVDSEPKRIYEQAVQILEEVIEPACAGFGIRPIRADKMTRAGEIPEQVFRLLRDADLVIADLTGANPNVMYELGLRHAVGRSAIQLGEHGRLPFDVSTIRTIQFARTENGLVEARKQLQASIETGLREGFGRVTATRVLHEAHGAGRAGADDTDLGAHEPRDSEEPGFLELIAETEDAQPRLTGKLEEMTAVIQQLGALSVAGTAQFEAATASGQTSAQDRLLLVRKFADSLEGPANDLEELAAGYAAEMSRVDGGISYLIGRIEEEPGLFGEAGGFPESVVRMAMQAREGMSSIESLSGIVATLGEADRQLRARTKRISRALQRVVSSSAPIFEWEARLRQVMHDRGQLPIPGGQVGAPASPKLAAIKQQRPKRTKRTPKRHT
jgi:hypothetical protein